MAWTDSIAKYCIIKLKRGEQPKSLMASLIDNFGIDQKDAALLTLRLFNEHSNTTRSPLIHLELVVAQVCNLRCSYCFCGSQPERLMKEETGRMAIDLLLSRSGNVGTVYITFFGGEPLLAMDVIVRLVDYGNMKADKAGKKIRWSMTSNGTLLDDKNLVVLAEKEIKVLISIDGDKQTHDKHRIAANGSGTYDAIIASLPNIKKYQPWTGARMTITPDSVEKVSSNIRHLMDIGFNQLIISPADCPGWTKDVCDIYSHQMMLAERHFRHLSKERHFRIDRFDRKNLDDEGSACTGKRNCRAGKTGLAVTPDGLLYPCSKFISSNSEKAPYILGTLETGLVGEKKMEELTSTPWRPDCLDCRHLFHCSGGCPAVNYLATGKARRTSPRECLLRKMEFSADELISKNKKVEVRVPELRSQKEVHN